MELEILKRFRDKENPELGCFKGNDITTLSKSELLEALDGHRVDGLDLCRLGGIDPRREELCKLLHFAGQFADEQSQCERDQLSARPGSPEAGTSSGVASAVSAKAKKRKVSEVKGDNVSNDDNICATRMKSCGSVNNNNCL